MTRFTCFSILVIFIILLQFSYEFSDFERIYGYCVKINSSYSRLIKRILKENHFTLWYEITPETYIVEYTSPEGIGDEVLEKLSEEYPKLLLLWEQLKVYSGKLKPADSDFNRNLRSLWFWEQLEVYSDTLKPADSDFDRNLKPPNLVCKHYYGFGVEAVWNQNISGKGVTIGVTDVGVDTDLIDLEKNIREDISFNFINNTSEDVKPERYKSDRFLDYKAISLSDHGNRVSSVIAAVKANNVCSAGIAFNANIAVLKIFMAGYLTWNDAIARALGRSLDTIDIFVNAWNTDDKFFRLDLATAEAIRMGATTGRGGRGTIYLFPTSPPGHGLTNNIDTITVGSIGQFGNTVENQYSDSSVISSVLFKGNTLTASSIVTTSYGNRCISEFQGHSAATAMMGGAIALALEANPHLSRRDIMHLLVEASSRKGLQESKNFRKNGAKRYFHDKFGFGLLDVQKLVDLAKDGWYTSTLWSITLTSKEPRKGKQFLEAELCNDCQDLKRGECVTKVEQIELTLDIETDNSYLKIVVISPMNTESVVIDSSLSEDQDVVKEGREMKFVSTHFWGELPLGKWKVNVRKGNDKEFTLTSMRITIYGESSLNSSTETHNFTCLSTKPGPSTPTRNVEVTTAERANREESVTGSDVTKVLAISSATVICLVILAVVAKKKIDKITVIQNNNNSDPSAESKLLTIHVPETTGSSSTRCQQIIQIH